MPPMRRNGPARSRCSPRYERSRGDRSCSRTVRFSTTSTQCTFLLSRDFFRQESEFARERQHLRNWLLFLFPVPPLVRRTLERSSSHATTNCSCDHASRHDRFYRRGRSAGSRRRRFAVTQPRRPISFLPPGSDRRVPLLALFRTPIRNSSPRFDRSIREKPDAPSLGSRDR